MMIEPEWLDGIGTTTLGFAFAFALGFAAWPGFEYLIHATLSHRFRTFVTPLHMGHHKNPHGVLTAPHAWVPTATAVWCVLWGLFGAAWATPAVLGLLAGFARYERLHWRIHFDRPRNAREAVLFEHHLAHHYRDARNYHGVTTRLLDRAFGTLPDTWPDDYAHVRGREPLTPGDTWAVYRPGGLRAMRTRGDASAAPEASAESGASGTGSARP